MLASLGRGTFGSVWRVRDLSLGREVALKMLHPRVTQDLQSVARFRREARLAAQLSHPAIVPIYDWDSRGDVSWYTMELAESGSIEFWGTRWYGDYPDASTFTDYFLSNSGNNNTSWGPREYDDLLAAAAHELFTGETTEQAVLSRYASELETAASRTQRGRRASRSDTSPKKPSPAGRPTWEKSFSPLVAAITSRTCRCSAQVAAAVMSAGAGTQW